MIVCKGTSLQHNDSAYRYPPSQVFSDLTTSGGWAAESKKENWRQLQAWESHRRGLGCVRGGKTVIWVEGYKMGHKGWL